MREALAGITIAGAQAQQAVSTTARTVACYIEKLGCVGSNRDRRC